MGDLEIRLKGLIQSESKSNGVRCLSLRSSDLCLNSIGFDGNNGGLLLEDSARESFVSLISMENCFPSKCMLRARRSSRRGRGRFLSVTLSDSNEILEQNGEAAVAESDVCKEVEKVKKGKLHGGAGAGGALNTTKHLWSGAVAAMVSRVMAKETSCWMYSMPTFTGLESSLVNQVWEPSKAGGSRISVELCITTKTVLETNSHLFVECEYAVKVRDALVQWSKISVPARDLKTTLELIKLKHWRRTFVAPLERLKLEYIVRGEQKNLFELIKTIAVTQGIKGFWKGNFVNILRTAPFKAIHFYSYEKYRDHLLKITGNEEATNIERFVAGAAAGITATVLCIPMDTIRTVMVAPGGEALGGLIGTSRHMIQTEGFFSLYKGLVPSIMSMAPSGAVFYGVYDILKSAYLHSPEGRKRLENMKQGEDLNALDQLELGTVRTLVYGAIAGACAEAATYPFEVVRRQLQLQVRATKMSTLATTLKIVEQGGIPALYTGLTPSLLQVLPSAAISYFVYEFMKIVLKVE
ncbi:hypothetical protein MTR67_019479 [Solanum verrucosum]|uniref:Mitochondrial adenine nucleotide transporter BTL3 n=1 Tax=Solanum verrucosum TaxID=315347 RepID=A0AAF0TNL1_SOLVR|nr:hypothetical protein MTR67_019479 [Solanum verrucosum]